MPCAGQPSGLVAARSALWRGVTVWGVGGGLGAVVDTEFGEDRADVVACGFGADAQGGGDVSIAVAGGEQFEHIAFAAGQLVWIGAGVGEARVGGAAAGLYQAVTGSTGRGARAEPAEGGQRRFHGGNVAAELGHGGVVGAAQCGPCVGGLVPVTGDFQLVGRHRLGGGGASSWAAGQV